jgi:hypothetical protein
MPPRKMPVRRKAKTAMAPARRTPKTKALAISDPVKREAPGPSMFDSQLALLGVLAAWSPVQVLVSQQAAFWEGVAGSSSAPSASNRKRPAKAR